MCTFTAIEHLALGSANIPTISAEEELSLLWYKHQRHFCFCLHGFRDIRTIWLFIWNAYWSGRWSLLSLIMLLHLRFKIASVSTAIPLPTSYFPENLSLNMLFIILGYYAFAFVYLICICIAVDIGEEFHSCNKQSILRQLLKLSYMFCLGLVISFYCSK